ncbi:hypothetical protein HID58_021964, partial [Brassica napus]
LTTFSPLTKLRPFKDNWRVRVKRLHSWKQTTTYGGDTFEMIFADEWGNKIQATCKRTLMYRVQRDLLKGEWGVIEKCHQHPAGGQYRATDHPYKMTIAEDAILSDVIGRVHELGDVQTVQVSGENRKRVLFRLVDAEFVIRNLCFYIAEQLEPFTENTKDQTIVCLIRFAKISYFRGELQITNAFDASLMYLNPVIPEIADLTQRLSDDHQSLAVVYKQKGKESKRIDDAEIKSISEVNKANQVEICKVICTIEAIDTDWTWFYFGCNRHNKRVTKLPNVDYGRMTKIDKPLFRCEGCQNSITNVSPKFKLHLIVKDYTSTCKLMLLGSIAKSIIGVPAVDLWDGSYEEIQRYYHQL